VVEAGLWRPVTSCLVVRPLSFLSDYGRDDEFVGVVHGVIAKLAPEVRVIDITHGVPAGDVRSGALALVRAIQYLPEGVALAVVDPGVGTARRAIAAETAWCQFVGPDNGLLTPAVAIVEGAHRVVSIENPELVIPASGSTFEGRDRFAPAAALLASGDAGLDDLGPEIDPGSLTPLLLPLPEREGGVVRGEAWWVDTFGNVQTNVSAEDLTEIGLDGDGAVPRRRARGAVGLRLRRCRAGRGTAPCRLVRVVGAGGARRPRRSRARAGRPDGSVVQRLRSWTATTAPAMAITTSRARITKVVAGRTGKRIR
jgi:S-adenosylmethionine hydrolase